MTRVKIIALALFLVTLASFARVARNADAACPQCTGQDGCYPLGATVCVRKWGCGDPQLSCQQLKCVKGWNYYWAWNGWC